MDVGRSCAPNLRGLSPGALGPKSEVEVRSCADKNSLIAVSGYRTTPPTLMNFGPPPVTRFFAKKLSLTLSRRAVSFGVRTLSAAPRGR